MLLSGLAGLVALAASACLAAPASAGEYEVWSCRGPVGQPLSAEAWQPRTSEAAAGDFWVTDDCATGGPFTMHMTDFGTGTRRARFDLVFDLPRGAEITGYQLLRALRTSPPDGPIYDYAAATREVGAGIYTDSGCASNASLPDFPCQSQGLPGTADDPANEVDRPAVSLQGLELWIGCVYINGCAPPMISPGAEYTLHESVVTISDNSLPVISSIDGTLAGPDAVTGKANLFVGATDTISGVASMNLSIDGFPHQTIDIDAPSCDQPYQVSRPCPGDAGRIFTVDTTGMSEGTHLATGTVTDASGNQTGFGPVGFTVEHPDPGPPPPDNGSPAVEHPEIEFSAEAFFHRPGHSATIGGRLTTSSGLPVTGAVLDVSSTPLSVKEPATVDLPQVTTEPDGRFSIPVPGQGARQVTVSFAPSTGMAATANRSVRVVSRLSLSLRPRPKKVRIGRKVTFAGRLTGAGPSAAGVPVEVQARVQGKWETVATVGAKSGGAFTWRYRFRYVKRNALFSFRTLVRAAPGWPWATVTSPVRKVRIMVGRR